MCRWLLAIVLACPAAGRCEVPDAEASPSIMTMPPALREAFAERVLQDESTRRVRLERMVDFVFDANGLGMRYEEGATYTVEQVYATRKANCLGFALLFLALAREAGLEAYPQAIEETLSWQREDGIFFRNSHVNVVVRIGPRRFIVDVARDAVILRGQPVRLTQRSLVARYHNNVAMESLARGELAAARAHMATALELEADRASHWSNAGVLELRAGDVEAARRAYDRALQLDPDNTNALFNMIGMARRDGDGEREARFRERLRQVQQRDPFHHFLQAIDYESAGDFANAVAHYRRAIKLHRGDHRFHAALANALQRSGDTARARDALERAMTLSEGATRASYRERLLALRDREPVVF